MRGTLYTSSKDLITRFLTAVALLVAASTCDLLAGTTGMSVNKSNLAKAMKGLITVDVSQHKSGTYTVKLAFDPSKRTPKMVESRELDFTGAKLVIPTTEKEDGEPTDFDLWVPLALGPSRGSKISFNLKPHLFRRALVLVSTLNGRNTVIYTIDLASFAK